MKKRPLFASLVISPYGLFAQGEHKPEWFPIREVQSTAPALPDLERRIQEFDARISDAAAQLLADQFA